jgi:hypothetical protein
MVMMNTARRIQNKYSAKVLDLYHNLMQEMTAYAPRRLLSCGLFSKNVIISCSIWQVTQSG